jgi:hypothetical protein
MTEPRFDALPARAGSRHQRPIYMVGDQTAKFIASQGFFMPQGECGAGAGFRERPGLGGWRS